MRDDEHLDAGDMLTVDCVAGNVPEAPQSHDGTAEVHSNGRLQVNPFAQMQSTMLCLPGTSRMAFQSQAKAASPAHVPQPAEEWHSLLCFG